MNWTVCVYSKQIMAAQTPLTISKPLYAGVHNLIQSIMVGQPHTLAIPHRIEHNGV